MSRQEFQVVLLVGGTGSRMYPLTEEIPKYMLPVANRPLISYQLEMLERVGFTEAILVTDSEIASTMKKYASEVYKGKIKVVFEVTKGHLGTAEVLCKIKDKIKNDFIVMSGDLIVDEHFLHNMADLHRTRDGAVTILLKKLPPPSAEEGKKAVKCADYVGLNDEGRLIYFSAAADLEDQMIIRKSLLRKYLNITIYTDLMDAHFYIFSKWVLDPLEKYQKRITSIKGEFIPFLVKLQRRKKLEKGGLPESILKPNTLVAEMSSSPRAKSDPLGCYAYVMEDGFCARVNTVQSYMDINREIPKPGSKYLPLEKPGKNNFIGETAVVSPKTQVGPECVVGDGTNIGEKCSVKKSNIGKHCNIGNFVKIINSVVMDYVTIQEKCTIQNSIVCTNAHIGAGSSLTQCQIGVSYNCPPNSNFKNETLVSDDDKHKVL